MIVEHESVLSHYLRNFILYTLGAIALLYAAYGYAKGRFGFGAGTTPAAAPAPPSEPSPPVAASSAPSSNTLTLESSLTLEDRKTLHVVRVGQERFLVAASGESTQCLARLENEAPKPVPSPVSTTAPASAPPVKNGVSIPWFTELQRTPLPPSSAAGAGSLFPERFLQSLRWLATSRSSKS